MERDELQERTKQFALRVVKLVDSLPNTIAGRSTGGQIMRAGNSVAANYHAARRARSRKEFTAKIGVVAGEADGSQFWLGLIAESDLIQRQRVQPLIDEADEPFRIFAKMRNTVNRHKNHAR